jgi:hypothetical protein
MIVPARVPLPPSLYADTAVAPVPTPPLDTDKTVSVASAARHRQDRFGGDHRRRLYRMCMSRRSTCSSRSAATTAAASRSRPRWASNWRDASRAAAPPRSTCRSPVSNRSRCMRSGRSRSKARCWPAAGGIGWGCSGPDRPSSRRNEVFGHVIARSPCDEAIHLAPCADTDCVVARAPRNDGETALFHGLHFERGSENVLCRRESRFLLGRIGLKRGSGRRIFLSAVNKRRHRNDAAEQQRRGGHDRKQCR